ncbi:MAG TPA: cation:proton antiporter [Nostocaceae cyanobacterium]|nr:cation:proton antiporter [Nostocaceae cyanobacterium]
MELLLQVLALEPTSQVLSQEPIVPFAILLVVILVIPFLFERLRLPGLVGLVCSGVLLGPSGWRLFQSESPMFHLLSDIGLSYLIFIAGLEVDLTLFRQQQSRSLVFGGLSFSIPLVLGALVGQFWGFNQNTSILLGSLLASHSLLGYPIISRLGIVKNEAMMVTSGAIIVTELCTLLVLAVCTATAKITDLSLYKITITLVLIIVYSLVVLVGFDWAGKEFFRRSGDEEGNKFLFVLLSVFLAAMGAQLLGIETILGVFLAGLAVNDVVGEGPVKERLVFIGSVLFIPIFFVDLGLQINIHTLFDVKYTTKLFLLILASLLVGKFVAATLTKWVYRYNWQEALTMWSLSLPLVGTTLAVALVGYDAQILPTSVLNSAIALLLLTSIFGPWLTKRLATGLTCPPITETASVNLTPTDSATENNHCKILVPIYNPQTQQYLIDLAAILARQSNGQIIPLAIATATAQMDAPQLETALQHCQHLLTKATTHSQQWGAVAEPLLRIDDAYAPAITRAAREKQANLIIMGWGKRTGIRAKLFGNVIDCVIWSAHCPVLVSRLMESPKKVQRILVPIENLTSSTLMPVQLAQILADANQAHVTLLSVCDRRTSSQAIAARREHLAKLVSNLSRSNPPEIQIIIHENVAQAIIQAARLYDLVIVPFVRNRTSPGGLAISNITTELAKQLTCSMIILGEPQHLQATNLPISLANSREILKYT